MKQVQKDFPILRRKINKKRIVYLDSAAMSLKPYSVISAVDSYYKEYSANVFRGIYKLSEEATQAYEKTRNQIAEFINANSETEAIFVRNTTEAINLVAYSWGRLNIGNGDEIVTTIMEHHSNFIPWQQLCIENNAKLKVIDVDNKGKVESEKWKVENWINKNTKLMAITHVSNVLGTINPIKEMIKAVKKINPKCLVVVDGAQAVPHMKVDVQDLGCDFYAFSGQKMLGPTGAGVLWGRQSLLEKMPPFLFGGEMVKEIYLDKSVYSDIPHKFEAGTPNIAGVIGLGVAVDYLTTVGMEKVRKHEKELVEYALGNLRKIGGIRVYGPSDSEDRGGVVSFNIFNKKGKFIHPHDAAQILDEDNIYVRAGHHCTMPLHTRFGIFASVRASFYIYNTMADIDMLIRGIEKVIKIFN